MITPVVGRGLMNISTSQNSIKGHGNRFNSWVYLGVKTCEVFLSFVAIIFLGSIVLTSQWLICIHCFTSLVSSQVFTPRMSQTACTDANLISSWLMVNSLIWLFRVLSPSLMFLCTTIARIFAYFKCIDSYSCSRENETLETISLNNERLSLVKTKFPIKNYRIVALNFTALQTYQKS